MNLTKMSVLLSAMTLVMVSGSCKRDVPESHWTDSETAVPTGDADQFAVGTVVETLNASKYTYVQLDTGVDKLWAAAPVCDVAVGDQLRISQGMPMHNFHSKTLERDFGTVYFVAAFQRPDGTPLGNAGHGMMSNPAVPNNPSKRTAGPTNVEVGAIEKAEGGLTVGEIHAQKDQLNGQEVKLRAQVTKYNAAILGKNWLHVQDGSGDSTAGTHDLTVTTTTTAAVGDTVLVEGTLQLDKDFGAGYRYNVIVEEANVQVE